MKGQKSQYISELFASKDNKAFIPNKLGINNYAVQKMFARGGCAEGAEEVIV